MSMAGGVWAIFLIGSLSDYQPPTPLQFRLRTNADFSAVSLCWIPISIIKGIASPQDCVTMGSACHSTKTLYQALRRRSIHDSTQDPFLTLNLSISLFSELKALPYGHQR